MIFEEKVLQIIDSPKTCFLLTISSTAIEEIQWVKALATKSDNMS